MNDSVVECLSKEDVCFAIDDQKLATFYQPVISLKDRSIMGFEALSRPLARDGSPVSPGLLFEAARKFDKILELDRFCREKAMERFHRIPEAINRSRPPVLFLNFDAALLNKGVAGSGVLMDQASRMGILPSRIVIEIVENAVQDITALQRFVDSYRDRQFLIAIDDVGAGYSNFDRIAVIKPEIIKVDRSIISGIDQDYYKREAFKTLVGLARKIGSLILAEGVETVEEVLCVMDCDADLLQGFYFSRPHPEWEDVRSELGDKIDATDKMLRKCKIRKISTIRREYRTYDEAISEIINALSRNGPDAFEAVLNSMARDFLFIEALYLLDDRGIMATDTILRNKVPIRENAIFRKAVKGDDLSMKEYFYLPVSTDLNRYVTKSYISLATGNLTRTISTRFESLGRQYLLCVDVRGSKRA
jgi:EAL domain-containing protein (putative c-di-GMP-specific phosphodiesterase class I)